MKVYAIISEHGACSIREQLEIVCISREVAESYIEAEYGYWRNAYIQEVDVICDKYEKPQPKPKPRKQKELDVGKELVKRLDKFNKNIDKYIPKNKKKKT